MKTELVTRLKPEAEKNLEGITKGERAILEGRTLTHAQAKEKLKKWLK